MDNLIKDSNLDFEIVSYEENLDEGIIELLETNPEEAMSWGYDAFDNKLGYILPGQLILIGGMTGCVDSETEFLTPTGWKKISKYKEGDLVGEYNNGICEFKIPIDYIKKEQKYGWRIKNKLVDMLLTEEHRVLYQTGRGIYNTKHLYEILDIYKNNNDFNGINIPYSFNIKDNNGIDLTDDELRLMVAVIADGHFKKNTKTNWCRINLKKENKKERLRKLLIKCGYEFKEGNINPKDIDFTTFRFDAPRRDKTFNEYYWLCNKHQLKIIYDEFVYWDGSIDNRNGNKRFSTTVQESADFIQYVIHITKNRKTSINIGERKGLKYGKDNEYIRISNDIEVREQGSDKGFSRIKFKDFSKEEMKDGFKYCFTTSTTSWIATSNGYIFITGNTGKSTFANQVIQNISNQGIKAGKFTLEDRHQDIKKKEIYYELGKIRKKSNKKNYPINLFMINGIDINQEELQLAKSNLVKKNKNILEIKKNSEKRINIDRLEFLVQDLVKQGCKIVLIDHINEFELTGDKDRNDLKIEEVMYKLKDIGRRYNIAILLIAHYKKLGKDSKPNDESFKDSIAIAQVSNKVIHLYRDKLEEDGITEVIITKNRDNPRGTGTLELNFDSDLGTYTNIKSQRQINKETSFI